MWTKLKAAQAEEVARREIKRMEVQKKIDETKMQKQSFNVGA